MTAKRRWNSGNACTCNNQPAYSSTKAVAAAAAAVNLALSASRCTARMTAATHSYLVVINKIERRRRRRGWRVGSILQSDLMHDV